MEDCYKPLSKKICFGRITSPPLCPTPCAQCITQLALRNETTQLRDYLSTIHSLNPYMVVRFDDFMKTRHDYSDWMYEMTCLLEYLFTEPRQEHFQVKESTSEYLDPVQDEKTSKARRRDVSAYSILPFYFIIFKAEWILPEVITLILESNLIEPIEIHQAVRVRSCATSQPCNSLKEYEIKSEGVTLITALYQSGHRTYLTQFLQRNPHLISRHFPESNQAFEWSGRSLLRFFLTPEPRTYMYERPVAPWNSFIISNCHCQFRFLKPLLEMGYDINSHSSNLFDFFGEAPALDVDLFAVLIADGLMDFASTRNLAPSRVILATATCAFHGGRPYRLEKARLLLELLHSLGASYHMTTEQKLSEWDFVGNIKDRDYITLGRELAYYLEDDTNWIRGNYWAHKRLVNTMDDLWAQRKNPLQLCELARIGVRNAVGGRWFASTVDQLPLPSLMKVFVKADLSTQFEQLDIQIDYAERHPIFPRIQHTLLTHLFFRFL